ncbi:unnamed protein product [Rhizoctonia solani]|uniref:NACHT domain-containing protein n=1 Tax=Rhizoctonia solani TaxID=456999 RepID=A0A8H3B892_9AGAM|nr:unnamed protein product [Rhizoctonia solani]
MKLTVAPKETTGSSSSIGNPTIANQFQVSQAATAQSGNPGGLRISARSFPPLQSAVGALSTCLEVFEQASIHREEYEALAMELEAVANFLQQHLNITRSSRILGVMSSVSRAIEKEVKLICEIRDGSHSRRIIHASKDEEVLVRVYRRVNELFSRLQIEIGMDTWSIANEHLVNTRLESLDPAKQASYDSALGADIGRRQCTKGTREVILADLYRWSDDPDAKSVYLMNGMAGTGKTAIACSLAKLLEDDGRLGASFFCTRTSESCRDANRIIPTIAYQLARYSTAFQSALSLALNTDPDLGSRNPTTQFERLLREPLSQIKDKIPKHVVVVIDALDECNNSRPTRLVFDLIVQFLAELPIKFFLTCRPELRVQAKAPSFENVVHMLHLHEVEYPIVLHDIELYLQEELACIEPSQSQITLLAKLAGNLFIFAATAVRYIRPEGLAVHSTERLNTILDNKFLPGSKRLAGIDSLYSTILASALENDDLEKQEIKRIYNILWTAVCIQEPVTIGTLAALAGLESADHASTSLESLRSVLHVSEHTGLVCILHASFPDYIFHCERSGRFFSDKGEKHRLLAHQCFKVMEQQLRFNICNLQTSYLFDHAVADLQERIESNIPAPLEYACQHWANHLCLAPVKHELCDALYAFLITKLLFWMEVLNLKQYHMTGLHALPNAQRWIAGTDAFHAFYDLPLFIHDATIFVTRFFVAQRLLRSVKFSPDGIKVASGSDDGSVCIWDPTTGALMLGPLEGYADIIWSIDFSPDSKLLVSGSNDGTLCVWDVICGSLIASQPSSQAHTGGVLSVGFSTGGNVVYCGSQDNTLRVWNVIEKQFILSEFQTQMDGDCSIAISPDGVHILSPQHSRVIKVHNKCLSSDKMKIAGISGDRGLPRPVTKAARLGFSADGEKIISSSKSGGITCVWDSESGRLLEGPLKGRLDTSWSAALPGGSTRISTRSNGRAIHIWGKDHGIIIAGPFQDGISRVFRLQLSPNGQRTISTNSTTLTLCSLDATNSGSSSMYSSLPPGANTYATWPDYSPEWSDSHVVRLSIARSTGHLHDCFRVHSLTVWSVALSPDGAHVALTGIGTNDHDIYIWDASLDHSIAGPFIGHGSSVRSVGFSQDGANLISGSDDKSIRIWDVSLGIALDDALEGHNGSILSAVF